MSDEEVETIKAANLASMAAYPLIAIVETPEGFVVHQHTPDSVFPQSIYPTRRLAVARFLQLSRIGPVSPQIHPEVALIETVAIGGETIAAT